MNDVKIVQELQGCGYSAGEMVCRGRYGTIYRGVRSGETTKVAIKHLSDRAVERVEPGLGNMYADEWKILAKLKHKHILQLYHALDATDGEGGTHRLALMEWCDAGSLGNYLRGRAATAEEQAFKWFAQLTSAVTYCHQAQVAHRNLNPHNLLLTAALDVKVKGFAYAKNQCSAADKTGTFTGCYGYTCPEILENEEYSAHKADVWSMGVILFYILFQKMPYDDTNMKRLTALVKESVTFPAASVPPSDEVKDLIANHLCVHEARRYSSSEISRHNWFAGSNKSSYTQVLANIKHAADVVKPSPPSTAPPDTGLASKVPPPSKSGAKLGTQGKAQIPKVKSTVTKATPEPTPTPTPTPIPDPGTPNPKMPTLSPKPDDKKKKAGGSKGGDAKKSATRDRSSSRGGSSHREGSSRHGKSAHSKRSRSGTADKARSRSHGTPARHGSKTKGSKTRVGKATSSQGKKSNISLNAKRKGSKSGIKKKKSNISTNAKGKGSKTGIKKAKSQLSAAKSKS